MNENKQPILSICIPTWNRWHSLQYTLKSIVEQEEFKSGAVEIVISDNASTDETESRIKNLCNEYNNIIYFRNKKNIGAMPNINKAYSLCSGRYVRCLSSHMQLLPNTLIMILDEINSNSPHIILNMVSSKSMKYDKYEILTIKSQHKDYLCFDRKIDFFDYMGNQFNFDKSSFYPLNNLFSNITCFIFKKGYYESVKLSIISKKGNVFFNEYNFIHSMIAYYKIFSKIIFNLTPIAKPTVIAEADIEKEEKTLRNRSDSMYLKDARYLTRYILKNYNCNKNFRLFVKNFNGFRLKLYLISNIPLIGWLKKKIPLSLQEKVRHFINTFRIK